MCTVYVHYFTPIIIDVLKFSHTSVLQAQGKTFSFTKIKHWQIVRRLLILQFCDSEKIDNRELKLVYDTLQFDSEYNLTGTVGTLKQ